MKRFLSIITVLTFTHCSADFFDLTDIIGSGASIESPGVEERLQEEAAHEEELQRKKRLYTPQPKKPSGDIIKWQGRGNSVIEPGQGNTTNNVFETPVLELYDPEEPMNNENNTSQTSSEDEHHHHAKKHEEPKPSRPIYKSPLSKVTNRR